MDEKILRVSNYAVSPSYSDCTVDIVPSIGSTPSYRRLTDVYLLFNQERLDKLTNQQLVDYVRSNFSESGYAEIRSKMSDDDLVKGIKSRYIQSKSELRQYMDYLRYQSEDELKRKEFERKQKEKQDKLDKQSNEPDNEPDKTE